MPRAWPGALTASRIARAASVTNANFCGRASLSTVMPRFLSPHLGRDRVPGDSPPANPLTFSPACVDKVCTLFPPIAAFVFVRRLRVPARGRERKNPQAGVLLKRSGALCPLNDMRYDDSVGDARSPIEHVCAGPWSRER